MGDDSGEEGLQPIFAELPDDPKLVETKSPKIGKLIKEFKSLPPVQLAERMDIAGRFNNLISNPETYVMLQKGLGIALFAGAIAGVYGHDVPAQFIIKAPDIINATSGNMMESALLPTNVKGVVEILERFGVPLVGDATSALESLANSHPKLEAFLVSSRDRIKEEFIDFGFKHQRIVPAMQAFGIQPPILQGAAA